MKKRIPEGSEGVCPHCKHKKYCIMSTEKIYGVTRLGCNGISELYPIVAFIPTFTYDKNGNRIYESPKPSIIKHHKFELRDEEK